MLLNSGGNKTIAMLILSNFAVVFLVKIHFVSTKETQRYYGALNCPQSKTIVLKWVPFPPSVLRWNITTDKIYGELSDFLTKVLPKCCPSLNYSSFMLKVNKSKDIEMAIRQDNSSYLSLYFPVLAHKHDTEQYQRPYIGLYYSPGPALLTLATEESGPFNRMTLTSVIKSSWGFLAFIHGLTCIFGVVIWILVRCIVSFPEYSFKKTDYI